MKSSTSRLVPFSIILTTIALVGAGCWGPPEVIVQPLETVIPEATPPAEQPAPDPTPEPATSTSESQTNEKSMTQETLAFPGVLPESETANMVATIHTDKGDIKFEILPKEGPNAASNFVYLAKLKFYDGLMFHRVESGFVIQGGDPNTRGPEDALRRYGTGGPGYQFGDDAVKLPYNKGIVAMANSGPNTNGSQFFIMLGDTPLPPAYSIFGRVISGQDVVDKIAVGDKMLEVKIEKKK
ncbi:MAG: peptidylprolyl isomerase [Patescibacteria group bacterium]